EELWWELNRDRVRAIRLLPGLIPELVALARMPKARGRFLEIFVRSSLQHAWDLHYQRRGKTAGFPNNLVAATKALRTAIDALTNLDQTERDLLEPQLAQNQDIDDYLWGEICDVAGALERALAEAESKPGPRPSGRPRGKVNAINEKLRSF